MDEHYTDAISSPEDELVTWDEEDPAAGMRDEAWVVHSSIDAPVQAAPDPSADFHAGGTKDSEMNERNSETEQRLPSGSVQPFTEGWTAQDDPLYAMEQLLQAPDTVLPLTSAKHKEIEDIIARADVLDRAFLRQRIEQTSRLLESHPGAIPLRSLLLQDTIDTLTQQLPLELSFVFRQIQQLRTLTEIDEWFRKPENEKYQKLLNSDQNWLNVLSLQVGYIDNEIEFAKIRDTRTVRDWQELTQEAYQLLARQEVYSQLYLSSLTLRAAYAQLLEQEAQLLEAGGSEHQAKLKSNKQTSQRLQLELRQMSDEQAGQEQEAGEPAEGNADRSPTFVSGKLNVSSFGKRKLSSSDMTHPSSKFGVAVAELRLFPDEGGSTAARS